MSAIPADCAHQIEDAYRLMAGRARYRPAAPSDGLGHITIPVAELDLDAEAAEYARDWMEQENACEFGLGCPDWTNRRAMIFTVEAARLCCGDETSRIPARRLLLLALEELGT